MALDTDKLTNYAELYLERKRHKERYNELTEQLAELQPGLVDHMLDEGIEKLSLTGGRTISIKPEIWPQYGHKSIAIEALKAAGITDMVEEGFNHQRLAGFIRELVRQGKELPKEFKGKIKISRVQKLVAKKL